MNYGLFGCCKLNHKSMSSQSKVSVIVVKVLLLFVLVFNWFSSVHAAGYEYMRLHVGSVKTLKIGVVERVAIGQDSLLATSVLSNGDLLLIPKNSGETDIKIWLTGKRTRTFRVKILQDNVSNRKAVVSSLLKAYPDITVRTIDDLVVIEGDVPPEDIKAFEEVAKGIPNVVSLVKPRKFVMKKMVKIKLRILEVNKRFQKELGIKWGSALDGPVVSVAASAVQNGVYSGAPAEWSEALAGTSLYDPFYYPYVGMAGSLASRIQLLEENGAGRTLAEPTLVSRSGVKATFHSGGEFPFVFLSNIGEPRVEFKSYGIMVEMTPTVDKQDNILLEIASEVSSIDGSTMVNGVPGLLTREVNSTINVKAGETVAISGLLSVTDNKNLKKVPFFGDIPFIGGLFRSKNRVENRTELVILATPEFVETAEEKNPENKLMNRHFEELLNTKKGYLDEELLE